MNTSFIAKPFIPFNMFKRILFFLILSFSFSGYGQGCSDAGFCTIESFKAHGTTEEAPLKHQIKIGSFYGLADYDIQVYGGYTEYRYSFTEAWSADVKLTSIGQMGNDISVFGLSDVFLTGSYRASESWNFTLGAKLPLNDANRKEDGLALPMDYQSSLGTYDLVVGVGYQLENVQFVAALQQPLTQNNNQFTPSLFPNESNLQSFQRTCGYVRRGDVLLRASYPMEWSEQLVFTPSLLGIYHLGNDQYLDFSDVLTDIEGSQGLTANINLYFDYKLNDESTLQLNLSSPFIVREARPDGLTRGFIANLEYALRF